MSRVYEMEMEMQEMAQDNEWNEAQELQEELTRQELDQMQSFEEFMRNEGK